MTGLVGGPLLVGGTRPRAPLKSGPDHCIIDTSLAVWH